MARNVVHLTIGALAVCAIGVAAAGAQRPAPPSAPAKAMAPAPAASPSAVAAGPAVELVTWKGTVVAADRAARTVTLKGPKGNSRTFTVHKAVQNFDTLKPGDSVHADFAESVVIFVRKSSDPPTVGAASVVTFAPKGALPAVSDVPVKEVEANVLGIDHAKRIISLMGATGNMWTFRVDPTVKKFDQIKKGNQIVARYTEAVVITITK